MRLPGSNNEEEAGFDLTPMIDVILLLIIFFMLSSQFAQSQLRPMDLPRERGQKAAQQNQSKVIIDMDREGKLSILGRSFEIEELGDLINLPKDRESALAVDVIVRADRSGSAVYLNRLADVLVQLGVNKWRLATNADLAPAEGSP